MLFVVGRRADFYPGLQGRYCPYFVWRPRSGQIFGAQAARDAADVTRAKDVLRVEAPGNGFAGSMSGTMIRGVIQSRPGVNPIAQPNPLPTGLTVNVSVLP